MNSRWKNFGWNIAAKNSRLVNCCEKFWVEKCEKNEAGEKFQGEKPLWKILVGRWEERTEWKNCNY